MWDPTVELTQRELHEGRFVEPEFDAPPPPGTLPEAEAEELIPAPAELEEAPEPASQ
jgi:hypothetical protein